MVPEETQRVIDVEQCLVPVTQRETARLFQKIDDIIDNTVQPKGLDSLMEMFAPKTDRRDPEISCAYFDQLEKFPTVEMSSDANETLRTDADLMYRVLNEKGVKCELVMLKNTFHACSTLGKGSPETIELMDENIRFMDECFSSDH